LLGAALGRLLYAVDLRPIDALSPNDPYVVLDGLSGPDAVIFDAEDPLVLKGISAGAPVETCPGFVVGVDFGDEGRAFATDFCDGTLETIDVDWSPTLPVPVPPERFSVAEPLELVAPLDVASLGFPRALPEGLLCSVRGPAAPVPEPHSSPMRAAALGALLAARAGRALLRSSRATRRRWPCRRASGFCSPSPRC
jgi:hypothetical protein